MEKKIYDASMIKHLDDIEHIRLRISMYLGEKYEPGLYKLDCEPVQNFIDEHMEGFGNLAIFSLNTSKNMVTVEDFGRGIPVEVLKDVFSKSNTGGKFDNNAYKFHAGANGVGNKVLCALSKYLRAEVYREPYIDLSGNSIPAMHGIVEFEDGRIKGKELIETLPNGIPPNRHRGTTVSYIVDDQLIGTDKHDIKRLADHFNNLAYQNPGLEIKFIIDGKVYGKYLHTGGITEHLKDFIKAKGIKPIIEPIFVTGNEENFDFNILFSYNTHNSGASSIASHVNGNTTPAHGYHVSATRQGASLALTQYFQETNAIPKSMSQYNVTGAIISENIVAVVGVRHKDPLFDGQTKDSFKSQDVVEPIKRAVSSVFGKWLRENPTQAKKLANLAIDYGKYEYERKKLKKNLVETKQVKSAFAANGIDPDKFTNCKSNNPAEREIFFVEGDSAGGWVALAQNREFQALYKLTGKVLNVVDTSKTTNLSKVILNVIQALGMGLPGVQKVDYNNLQYHKIIILTDADDDGAHITTLLLGFLYTFYPKSIIDGHVFVANPPIKKIILSNGSSFYIQTDAEFDILMKQFILNSFELYSEKTNKKLSKGLFDVFIDACRGYNELMDNHSHALAVKPDLLEKIIININLLTQCQNNDKNSKKFQEITGYSVKITKNNLYSFDKGLYHANLQMDKVFFDEHFDKIVKKLNEIQIYGVYLKGIRSNCTYHGTIYELNEYMNSILGPKIKIRRFKGLGEMAIDDLSETVINPLTRKLTRVTMKDCEKAEKAVKIFMSDADIKFKRLFYAGERDFD